MYTHICCLHTQCVCTQVMCTHILCVHTKCVYSRMCTRIMHTQSVSTRNVCTPRKYVHAKCVCTFIAMWMHTRCMRPCNASAQIMWAHIHCETCNFFSSARNVPPQKESNVQSIINIKYCYGSYRYLVYVEWMVLVRQLHLRCSQERYFQQKVQLAYMIVTWPSLKVVGWLATVLRWTLWTPFLQADRFYTSTHNWRILTTLIRYLSLYTYLCVSGLYWWGWSW